MTDKPCNIRDHVSRFFPNRKIDVLRWKRSPLKEVLPRFEVIRFAPNEVERGWLFLSDGAAVLRTKHGARYEFLIISTEDDPIHIETLSMVVNFMADARFSVHPGKILDIGRPWTATSNLDHILVSLPYPFGPRLERCGEGVLEVQLLWLQPIALSEAKYAEEHGLEALEKIFEEKGINYMTSTRAPAV